MAKERKRGGGLQGIIADNVRRLRKAKGLSQEELADVCGYHRTYVGGIERGERISRSRRWKRWPARSASRRAIC